MCFELNFNLTIFLSLVRCAAAARKRFLGLCRAAAVLSVEATEKCRDWKMTDHTRFRAAAHFTECVH